MSVTIILKSICDETWFSSAPILENRSLSPEEFSPLKAFHPLFVGSTKSRIRNKKGKEAYLLINPVLSGFKIQPNVFMGSTETQIIVLYYVCGRIFTV